MAKKMNEDVKAKWTAALRSGDYAQDQGALKRQADDGSFAYCCLGVLCEIAVSEGVIEAAEMRWSDLNGSKGYYPSDYAVGQPDVLPRLVQEWAGLSDSNPDVTAEIMELDEEQGEDVVTLHTAEIAEFNDSYGYDFAKLADLIDAQL